jgi:hypothetical protein
MSKIALSGNSLGSGTLTISAPNTNVDRVLSLPDSAGTLDTLQRAGNVLQVVQGSTSTDIIISTSTYADTGLSASITPTSTSSKILVIISQSFQTQRSSNDDAITAMRIVRDTTTVVTYNRVHGIRAGTGAGGFAINIGYATPVYLDSPNTTSAITYKTQFSLSFGTNSVANSSSTVSTITLMEIAG